MTTSGTLTLAADPGHGGTRSGALTPGGFTREADLTLAVALAANAIWPSLVLTRCDDTTIGYRTRARAMESFGVDLVICLHYDSVPWAPKRRGLDAYHHIGNGVTRRLARFAVNNAPDELRGGKVICAHDDPSTSRDDWIRRPQYLCEVYPMDVLLLEMGFLSNDANRGFVISTDGINACAELVIECCKEYRWIKQGRRDDGES